MLLPAGLRQRDQTKKSPTGPLDREALLQYLEQQALEVKERDDLVPFTGEKKGMETLTSMPPRTQMVVSHMYPFQLPSTFQLLAAQGLCCLETCMPPCTLQLLYEVRKPKSPELAELYSLYSGL